MIQYKYFHASDGYKYRLSIGKDNEEYGYLSSLFEALRGKSGGESTFVYAPLDKGCVFLQGSSPNNETFIHGVYCEDVKPLAKPVDYFGSLEVKMQNPENAPEVIEPIRALNRQRIVDKSYISRLHRITPTLIDAILYGEDDKEIVIVADDNEGINYIKALGLILPDRVLKKIGFCYGSSSVSDEKICTEDGSTVKIKIWAPKLSSFYFENYESSYYVFDVRGAREPRHSYDKAPSTLARAIETFELTNESAVNRFKAIVDSAFTQEGELNEAGLEISLNEYMFRSRPNIDSARAIFNTRRDNIALHLDAVEFMLTCELDPSEVGQIIALCNSNAEYQQRVGETLYNYISARQGRGISQPEAQFLNNTIMNDQDGDRFRQHFSRFRYTRNFTEKMQAFYNACQIIEPRLEGSNYSINGLEPQIETIIETFDTSNWANEQAQSNGEGYFTSTIPAMQSPRLQILATAMLMISAYTLEPNDPRRQLRLRGLRILINNISKSVSPLDSIYFLINVRDEMIKLSTQIETIDVLDPSISLMTDESYSKSMLSRIIATISCKDLLALERRLRLSINLYEGLYEIVFGTLTNDGFVRKNIKNGADGTVDYIEFYESLSESKKVKSVTLHLDRLGKEDVANNELMEYRCDFVTGCYKTLSDNQKKQVSKEPIASISALPTTEERINAVSKTIDVFGTNKQIRIKKKKLSGEIGIWAFIMALISGLILLIPSFVQIGTLGLDSFSAYINCVVDFIKPYYVVIPAVVYLIDIVSYFVLAIYNERKKTNINEIKNANIITILCGLFPTLIYVLSYIIFYHLSIGSLLS